MFLALILDRIGYLLVLELIQQLHQEEGKLQFAGLFIVEFLNTSILYAYLDEILSSYLGSVIHYLIHLLLRGQNVLEVDLSDLEALLVRHHNCAYILI